MKEQRKTEIQLTRREFLGNTAALAAFSIVPRHVLAGDGQPAPSEKMNIGCVGVGGMQGGSDVQSVSGENIYALCDVDESMLNMRASQYPNAKRYRDFREMLDKEQKNLHGITITIPDHMHASVALWAMERDIAVYCQKPLTQSVWEARLLTKAARYPSTEVRGVSRTSEEGAQGGTATRGRTGGGARNAQFGRRAWDRDRGCPGWRRAMAVITGGFLILAVLGGAAEPQRASLSAFSAKILDSDHLYNLTNVWTVHLKFAPDQWEAMEPKGGPNPFGGGPRGGGPGGLSAAKMLSPVFMSQGDLNRDGQLSRDEFGALAGKWFKAWDSDRTDKLDEAQIRAGLDKIRSPGRGGFGMMLQGPEGKRNGLASAMGIEFVYVHADLEFEGHLLRDVGVRHKGNGTFMQSRDSLKRSLKIDLNKYVKGQALGGVTMLTLQNNVTDASWMNEVLAYRLYRDAEVPAPRTAYAKVFVTVPGKLERKYFGLYSLSENVDKHFAEQRIGTKRGAIFKPVTSSLFADLGADWSAYNQTYDPKTVLYDEQKKAVMDLCRLVTQAEDAEFARRIAEFIDLPEFARFMAVMVYLSDLDGILGPGQNLYLHLHPKTQQFQFIPWDQDHSWGQFERASQEQRDNLSIHRPWQGENLFLERMFKLEAFKKLYLARMEEFSKTIFRPERLAQQVDEVAAAIRSAVQEESESKLARFDKVVAGESLSGGGFGPFDGGRIKPIKPFVEVRTQSVLDQVAGKSQGQVVGGGGFPGGGPGGRGGPGRPGGGGGFGLGMIFSGPLLKVLDEDKDSAVTQAEFTRGFARLFEAWNTDKSGRLTLEQLRSGIDKDLSPSGGGFPPFGPGGGPGGPGGGPWGRPGEGPR